MMVRTRHNVSFPPPLMTSEPGSFARKTIVERKPQIIRRVIEDNSYPAEIVDGLAAFKQEIASKPIRPLTEAGPDIALWNQALAAYARRGWLEVPWYLAEALFYRRLLETVRYFQPGPWQRHDPFKVQKQGQIERAVERLAAEWDPLAVVEPDVAFEALLHSSLWGNRADLSNYTVDLAVRGGLAAREERDNILIDDTEAVRLYLAEGLQRVDIISDNVGLDLLFDLVLADMLLHEHWAEHVVFHLKAWPFFVSDAMLQDLYSTVSVLRKSPKQAIRLLGARLESHLAEERLTLECDGFWTSPLMFRQFPPSLRDELALSALVIVKGDVNYRRLLDDRHWPHTVRLEEIAAYFPAPFLVLRTLKGEIQVGLAPGQAEALAAEDPDWLINGQRGLVQFCRPVGQQL